MTSKQFIQTISNIKDECKKHKLCCECIFVNPSGSISNCQIMELLQTLAYNSPFQWNITKIEGIINETN